MSEVSAVQRFQGSVRLVTLHLWRVGQTTDLDLCLQAARDRAMIDAQQEAFIRECIEAERLLEEGGEFRDDMDSEVIARLQRCALALNTADPA